jgi:hypothetical protein
MVIKFKGNLDDIFGNIYKKIEEQITPSIIEALEAVCIDVVNEARSLPSPPATMRGTPHQPNYIDDTENLRSSIGYVIYNNGQRISQNFEGKSDGVNKGIQVADTAAQSWGTGIVAVIVAGEDYAGYVESKGYDVLSGPASNIRPLLEDKLSRLKNIVSKYG